MQGKLLKIVTLICIFFFIISIFPNKSSASWVDDAKGFIKAGGGTATVDDDKLKDASDSIYNLLSSIGMIISVVVGIVLGITFMMASAEDKAKVKEALIPYIVGCVVVFGAFGIWKIIINTFSGI
ncbi:MAG: pilin [Clostridia bacterium]